MSNDQVQDFIEECRGMSEEQIIAAHYADYYDAIKPYVRKAFEQMGIAQHEVDGWVYRNIK